MKSLTVFKQFVERIEDAAQYDDVAVYKTLKRWATLYYGDNPPYYVVSTLNLLRRKFGEDQIARLLSISKTSARPLT